MSEEIRSWINSEGTTFTAKRILVDSLGHSWYFFEEPLKMPTARALDAEFAVEWANLNITPEDLTAYIDSMDKMGRAGNIVEMFKLLALLRERVKWACERKTLIELAKVYFVIDDEPLEACTVHHGRLKEDVWNKDTACASFFLQRAFVITRGFSAFSETDIHAYLKAQELIHLRTPSEPQPSTEQPSASPPSRKSFMEGVRKSTRKRS